jgi:hypothetical protein
MLALSLRNAPQADIIHLTAEAWYLSLEASGQMYAEARDAHRLLKAFKKILPTLKFWPSPADILENLPKIENTTQIEAQNGPVSDELQGGEALWSLLYDVIDGKIDTEEAIKQWQSNLEK